MASDEDDFSRSATFAGPRRGFFFGTGKKGTGYYRDHNADQQNDDLSPTARLDGAALLARAEARAAAAVAQEATEQPTTTSTQNNLDDLLLDAAGVRRLSSQLRKRAEANAVARAKHAAEPSAFLASELALDDAIRALQRVAPFPDLYPHLLKNDNGGDSSSASGVVETLVGLLSHENADIAGAVLEVLQELTDVDEGGDDDDALASLEASAAALSRSFASAGGGEAAAERLSSFDESVPEEAGFLFAGLSALLNMAELDEGVARCFVGAAEVEEEKETTNDDGGKPKNKKMPPTTKLLPWLLRRISSPSFTEFTSIAQASSELVSTLAQAGAPGALAVVRAGGVDSLLRALAKYRKRPPAPDKGSGEQEHVANLFDALCALLLRPEGRAAFVEAEGVELMLLLIRKHGSGGGGEKQADDQSTATAKLAAASSTAVASSALRCLEFATTNSGGGGRGGGGDASPASLAATAGTASTTTAEAAKRFVEGGGLGPLFGGFMGRSRLGGGGGSSSSGGKKGSKKEARVARRTCLGLVANLLQCLDPDEVSDDEGQRAKAEASSLSARVLAKFREVDFEKLERLAELASSAASTVSAHDARVAAKEKLLSEEGRNEGGEDGDAEEEREAKKLVARLAAGGDELQLCSLVAAYLWESSSSSRGDYDGDGDGTTTKAAIVKALHRRRMTLSDLRRALRDRKDAIGGDGGESAEERRLERLLAALGGRGGGGSSINGGGEERAAKRPKT